MSACIQRKPINWVYVSCGSCLMNPRFRFRKVLPRNDLTEIKDRCNRDSIEFKDQAGWNSLYKDTFHEHSIDPAKPAKVPPVSVSLGGGSFAPTREELRSSYMNTFHKIDPSARPVKVPPLKNSELFPTDNPLPKLSTAHEAMIDGSKARAYAEPQSARSIQELRSKNFDVGYDRTNYTTTTGASFSARRPDKSLVAVIDTDRLMRSSVAFDKTAGLGPYSKSLAKRRDAPACADAAPFDQRAKNFDLGHEKDGWMTTSRAMLSGPRGVKPLRCNPPECAELSNHGQYAPTWSTSYNQDYIKKTPIANNINNEDLRKTHWDPGHEKSDWPVHEAPQSVRREKIDTNLQSSNIVFRGDGAMYCSTTTREMLSHHSGADIRAKINAEGRADHISVGSDKTDYSTTAKEANRLAGTGKPAQSVASLYANREQGFATGGTWDRHKGSDCVDEKEYRPVEPTKRVDGRYYRSAHFDLEATSANKPRYTTTYYKDICEPTLE